jgi:hypothetical protein
MLDIVWNPPVPQTVQSFKVTFGSVDISVEEVRGIVENHFVCWNQDVKVYEGFNKIFAIKELRDHFQLLTKTFYEMWGHPTLWISLREAKEMIDAVYQEGLDAGKYRASCNCDVRSLEGRPDKLPF